MSSAQRRRCVGDGGSVIVEAAFVMPILLVIVLGLMDFSVWEFQESQASSAARDGARVGVLLSLDAADQSATKTAISDAVRAKIPDSGKLKSFNVRVWCAGGTPGTDFNGCLPSKPGQTRLVVEASWTYVPVSFVGERFGSPKVTSTAEMVWTGPRRNAGSTAPPVVCGMSTSAVSGETQLNADPGRLVGSGQLTVQFTLVNAAQCTSPSAQFLDSAGLQRGSVANPPSVSGSTATVTVTTPSNIAAGDYTVVLTAGGRDFSKSVAITVQPAPGQCSIAVTAPQTATLARNNGGQANGDLTADVPWSFTPSNCAGAGTVQLVRQDGANYVVFQSASSSPLTSGPQSGTFSKSKSANASTGPGNQTLSFVAGTYFVRVISGSTTFDSSPIQVGP